jgi:hypothetical protein
LALQDGIAGKKISSSWPIKRGRLERGGGAAPASAAASTVVPHWWWWSGRGPVSDDDGEDIESVGPGGEILLNVNGDCCCEATLKLRIERKRERERGDQT